MLGYLDPLGVLGWLWYGSFGGGRLAEWTLIQAVLHLCWPRKERANLGPYAVYGIKCMIYSVWYILHCIWESPITRGPNLEPAILAVERGFKVSSGTVKWYRSSYGTGFDNSEIASPLLRNSEQVARIQKPYFLLCIPILVT